MRGLAITSLRLSQFRTHRRLDLEPGPGAIAVFGPNGAGKTNLLEAVSMLSPGRGLRRAAPEQLARSAAGVGWRIAAEIKSGGRDHEIETGAEVGASRSVRIDDKAAPQVALGRIAPMVWLIPAMDRLWTDSAEGRRRFLDRMVLSFDPAHGEAVLAYEKAMRERNRLLRDEIRDAAWYEALEAHMAAAGERIIAAREEALQRISAAQEGAATAFPAANLSMAGPDGSELPGTESELRTALLEGRTRDMAAGRTLTGPHRADLSAIYTAKGVPASQCSTGEQKALLLSLVLANARALAAEKGCAPILLLDEVAAHLDAGRRAALYAELAALRAQAWLTGTGAELFEDLAPGAQRLAVAEEQGESLVTEVAW